MAPAKEIGECLITVGEDDYFFRPSFANMMRIGDPQEIVQTFHHLHYDELTELMTRAIGAYGRVPHWLMKHVARPQFSKQIIYSAVSVLSACCDKDICALVGELRPGKSGRWTFVYLKGALPVRDIVVIAQSLIQHGIIGKAKVRQLQRHESGQATTEFNAFEYINAARNHFNMSRAEAEQLSMTEFQQLLAAKYPDQKGFTRDEYESIADEFLDRQAARRAKAKK